ncbi:MAG TPA: arsenosugar biosynthesis radical SAM (seleno)protein ArsS [Longimicrobium sp.]|jgi:radical SAM/Cys-rich protein|uniref:arsenosugar biosynthesis radical SAM (seleno)protein ArsS n=1 Tax=Longimicrobium sp. TaxID=2029185 RepID=UPI002ED9A60A
MSRVLPTLQKRASTLSSTREQRGMLGRVPVALSFESALQGAGLFPLTATGIDIFQINVGRKCNQTCRHCHVDAGPDRTEMMPDAVMDRCLEVIEATDIPTVDITGGAPELHKRWRELVVRSRAAGKHVMDRCNLTITLLPNYAYLPEFFAEHAVHVVASLPHYRPKGTDAQRGDGVFGESIQALQRLNALGYGDPSTGLQLDLVTNPVGTFLPGNQAGLEAEWKRQMERLYGIRFNRLFTITNMPISRYLEFLEESGKLNEYMERLVTAFNPAAAAGVMCRNTLSVGWEGTLYDCDFNQMLELSVDPRGPRTIFDFDLNALAHREIVLGPHCFGCTAGAGSSCGGATA